MKEHGSDLIEVQDNGCGVEERDFQLLSNLSCSVDLLIFTMRQKRDPSNIKNVYFNM